VHDYGAGVSLEIARTGPALLVPFTRASVPQVDVRGGAVTVVAPDEIEVPPEAMPEAMQDHAEEARA
jgi:16S rRNA processing protein RimM